jgi:DnaJ-class molecular chaperone
MTEEWSERVLCNHCDGTGDDEAEWDGRCIFCNGTGEIIVWHSDDEHDDEGP